MSNKKSEQCAVSSVQLNADEKADQSNGSSSSLPTAHCSLHTSSGADILVQQLIRHGVDIVFAYPGGSVIPLHQAYSRYRDQIRIVLPRHEQGGAFAAQGYARSTGKVGVVSATSGPGAANLLTGIADANLDSVPMVVITGQVPTKAIGTDAFQEMPTTEVFKSITKHHYLIQDINDITRVFDEAFYIANTGRKGPVLVDVPKDVLVGSTVPHFNPPMQLPGYHPEIPPVCDREIDEIVDSLTTAKKPVIMVGGGVIASEATEEARALAHRLGIPVCSTIMGLGAFPSDDPLFMEMVGMHGSVCANMAVNECDCLLVLGCRFSDRVSGRLSEFASKAKIIHVDLDRSELHKIVRNALCIEGDVKTTLQAVLKRLTAPAADPSPWLEKTRQWMRDIPLDYNHNSPHILPQEAIAELSRQSGPRSPFVTTGVGQHQMWAAQFFKLARPRQFMTSGGAGTMGFGLPVAMGVQAANPKDMVLCIEGDGSVLMNIQEMATCYCEHLPVKMMILNNQHLGMVMQWEDRFFKGNRGNTYLGPIENPETLGQGDGFSPAHRYPDFAQIAKGFGWESRSIINKQDLSPAVSEMLAAKGPYMLDVAIPYQEHVLPMIPAGCGVKDLIRK